MADLYVRSTDGNNADDGSTWALAEADLHTTAWAAGSRIFVSDAHAQTTAGTISIASGGTQASPTQIICVDDAAEPPAALATTATVTITGATSNQISVTGSCYLYGLSLIASTTGSTAGLSLGTQGSLQVYENCVLNTNTAHSSGRLNIGGATANTLVSVIFKNCTATFSHVTQGFAFGCTNFVMEGGSISGSAITGVIKQIGGSGRGSVLNFSGVDLSAGATALALVAPSTVSATIVFRNCKLPASWSGTLFSTAPGPGVRAEMHNCDDGDTNYRLWVEDYAGSIKQESTIGLTGGALGGQVSGATDLTVFSWKMTSSADAEFPLNVLESPEIVQYNSATGSSKTVTVEFLIDSATTLYKEDVWLEVMYLGTSAVPLGAWDSDSKLGLLDARATTECATGVGTATWAGEAGTAKSYKLVSTITPQEKGYIHARVVLAKASTTIYVDPKLTVA